MNKSKIKSFKDFDFPEAKEIEQAFDTINKILTSEEP